MRQNWRTFAMKGEWLRQQDGYIGDGVEWIEADWLNPVEGGQRERFRRDLDQYHLDPHFFFYHDNRPGSGSAYTGADPETFAYNGATTANLLDMLEGGYNGPSAKEMREYYRAQSAGLAVIAQRRGRGPGRRSHRRAYLGRLHLRQRL